MNEQELMLPAPYDKYYEIVSTDVAGEIPEAFNNYSELDVLAKVYAKEHYEDALADNCLDCVWLVSDEVGKQLLVTAVNDRVYPLTLEEVMDCVGLKEASTSEPSSVEYGNFLTNHYKEIDAVLQKYGITKLSYRRSTEYAGTVNGHKFFFVEGNTGTGHYAKELYIDGREVDLYQSKESTRSLSNLNDMNYFGILSLVKMLETDNLGGIVYRDVDTLDDYEESLVEDTEMSDAQRLALQELDTALDCGELDSDKHAFAYQIQWDINFEDVLLFINGINIDLKDIKHVEYGDCDETEFDGCYSVTLHNGEVKRYGWHDFDMTGSLTCIDSNVNEDYELITDKTFIQHPMNYDVTDSLSFEVQDNVKVFIHRGPGKQKEYYIIIGDAYVAHSFNKLETVERYLRKNKLVKETMNESFKAGDPVYVSVANRQGRVLKMISDDVVEVELESTFLYPARIDRYYTSEVELVNYDPDKDDDGLDPVVIEHPEDIDTYLADPDNKFIPDDEF